MATYVFASPVVEGKSEQLRSFTAQMLGDRRSEAEAVRRTAGIDREQVFVQKTPMGDVAIIAWDTADFDAAFRALMTDTSDFGAWFRSNLQEIHGLDFADPTMQAPKPELVGEWKDDSWAFGELDSWAFAFPVKDIDLARSWVKSLLGEHRDEFISTRREFGVARVSFLGLETPNGAFAISYIEGAPGSFPKAFATTSTSTEEFLVWWREQVQGFAAVPMFTTGKAPEIEKVMDFKLKVPAKA